MSVNSRNRKQVPGEIKGPRYWRSLDDLLEAPAFKDWMEREFPRGAAELNGVNRRHFLKIMAASFGMAGIGLTSCRRPEQYILPYSKQLEIEVPGVPVHYATSIPGAYDNIPLVVETHQNRPSKVEGNDEYPNYGGATDIYAQASVLDLYDPDRATRSSEGVNSLSRARVNDLLKSIGAKFSPTSGQGLAFLAEQSTSPTRARLVKALQKKLPRATWAEYEPVSNSKPEEATERLFGRRLRPHYLLKGAKRILSLDADFLSSEPGHLQYARDFAERRRVHSPSEAKKMNRLYQVESGYSITGGMADHRLRLSTSQISAFAALVAAELLGQKNREKSLAEQLRKRGESLAKQGEWIAKCVADLNAQRGKSVVIAGSHLPHEVHQLVYFINDLLGAGGKTVNYLELPSSEADSILGLAEKIESGRIETLVIIGGNPVYNAPADVKWQELQKKVPEVVRYGYYFDETSLSAKYHIAATHYLESWGDGRTYDGTLVPVQPMTLPLFEGIQEIELLARITGSSDTDAYAHIQKTFQSFTEESDKERAFNRFLSDGMLKESGFAKAEARFSVNDIRKMVASTEFESAASTKENLEVRIVPDPKIYDGRYNNNGWLQECPDPLTKITWDNVMAISPHLAAELGYDPTTKRSPLSRILDFAKVSSRNANEFEMGREVAPIGELTLNGTKIRGPVHIQPGIADYTVVVNLGYGREKVGRVGTGSGFSVYPLVHSASPGHANGAQLKLTEETYLVANTQEHWSMEGRALIREGNVEDFVKHPDFVEKMGIEAHSPSVYRNVEDQSLQWKALNQPRGNSAYETPTFGGAQQWGMSIDLNTCIGCAACVVACQSENNIPIVGKDQVTRGREMHWLRLDRYYSGGDLEASKEEIPQDPQVSIQPVLCMHCENAPCEQVCPVNATVHDDEGLNVMAYNRCVGTRYCSNNCPYKVRRFNFFNWNKRAVGEFYEGPIGDIGITELGKMQKNPDVTVRMRGVMEKCTYCQQRIEEAKINQKVKARNSDNVKVPDGVIRTACQQVCPTDAIVFGDVADADTRVSKIKKSELDYGVLAYLNTRPRTTYLARLRNPNPDMPDYHSMPLSRQEYEMKSGHGSHGDGAGH